MTDQPPDQPKSEPPLREMHAGWVVASEGSQVELVGAVFLALLAFLLLFALLRAQKRNRALMRELMEAKAGE